MDLTVEKSDGTMAPLLPQITATSRSYTYRAAAGLLFSTQFTQPAIMLVEKSAFVELLDFYAGAREREFFERRPANSSSGITLEPRAQSWPRQESS